MSVYIDGRLNRRIGEMSIDKANEKNLILMPTKINHVTKMGIKVVPIKLNVVTDPSLVERLTVRRNSLLTMLPHPESSKHELSVPRCGRQSVPISPFLDSVGDAELLKSLGDLTSAYFTHAYVSGGIRDDEEIFEIRGIKNIFNASNEIMLNWQSLGFEAAYWPRNKTVLSRDFEIIFEENYFEDFMFFSCSRDDFNHVVTKVDIGSLNRTFIRDLPGMGSNPVNDWLVGSDWVREIRASF